jgi:LacI family transcriptional regulator
MSAIPKEITIYDIARALNVSAATVSRGLAGHESVNIKTRQKITEAAQAMGYRSNQLASNLRKQKSNVIGIMMGTLRSSFMSNVIAGAEEILSKAGYNLIISQTLESLSKEINTAKAMYNNRVDGLMVSLAYETENLDHFDSFVQRGIPLVYFDRVYPHPHCIGVSIDNVKAGYDITEHLIKQGCKRIMHMTAFKLSSVAADRFAGYKKALEDYNIPFDENLITLTPLALTDGTEVARQMLDMENRPDGIFVANDACAVSCIQELKRLGINVPGDIAVAGFNNDTEACIIEPNLTTVNYNGYEMGRTAATHLLDQLIDPSKKSEKNQIILDSDIIIRESSLKKA